MFLREIDFGGGVVVRSTGGLVVNNLFRHK